MTELNWNSIWEDNGSEIESYLRGSSVDVESSEASSSDFCTAGNLPSCIKYINQTLEAFGHFVSISEDDVDQQITQCVNIIYLLLRNQQKESNIRDELMDKHRRTQSEKDILQTTKSRLEERVAQLEKEVAQRQAKERVLSETMRSNKEKWDSDRDDLQKRMVMLQHKDVQYQHEKRKMELQYNKLKERLNQMSIEKNRETTKYGLEISQVLAPSKRRVAVNKSEMYRMVLEGNESQLNTLRNENAKLKDGLKNLSKDVEKLHGLLENTQLSATIPSSTSTAVVPQSVEEAEFESILNCPYDSARGTFEDYLGERISLLRREILLRNHTNDDHSYSPQKLDHLQRIIKEQDQLLQLSLSNWRQTAAPTQDLNESQYELERQYLEEQKRLFDEEKDLFQSERRKVSQELIQLSEDRASLERERKEFREQQRLQEQNNDSFWRAVATPPRSNNTQQLSTVIDGLDDDQVGHSFSTPQNRRWKKFGPALSPIVAATASPSGRKTWSIPIDTDSLYHQIVQKQNSISTQKENIE